jgi:inner membrane transporter RhtA
MPRAAPGRLSRVPAPALVLAAILSVQAGAGIARQLFDDLGAAGTTLVRLGLSALVLGALVRPRVRRWTRRQWLAVAVLGVVMGAMNLLFYLSLRTVPLGVAVTVEFLGPLMLALAQTRRRVDVAWAVLAAGGVALLGLQTTTDIPLSGLALAFAAGLCWVGYILASAHVGAVLTGLEGLAGALAVATVLVLPFGLSGATGVLDQPVLLLAGAGVALLSSVVPYGLEMLALRRLPTRVFGILMSLEPAAGALSGLVVLGQALHAREVVALVLVSAASAGTTMTRRTGPAATTAPS